MTLHPFEPTEDSDDAWLELGEIRRLADEDDGDEPSLALALGSNIHALDGTPRMAVQVAQPLSDLEAVLVAYLLDLDA